jgi:hypothetical protein
MNYILGNVLTNSESRVGGGNNIQSGDLAYLDGLIQFNASTLTFNP